MTPRWSNVNSQLVIRKLLAKGFKRTRQKGSHAYLYNKAGAFAIVPIHKGRNLSKGVIQNIMKTSGLTKRELEE